MNTVLIIAGCLVLSLIVAAIALSQKVRRAQRKQVAGLRLVSCLQMLISLLQSHRGLCMAYFRGDLAVEPDLNELTEKINAQSDNLHSALKVYSRWSVFRHQSPSLSHHHYLASIEQNFAKHTVLIEHLLYLLEDLAESHELRADSLSRFPNIGYIWRELLWNIESIGRCRATGVKIVTQGSCSSVEKTQLIYLHQKIVRLSNQTAHQLSSEDTQLNGLLKTAKGVTDHLMQVIDQQLLSASTMTISGREYFQLASDAMASFSQVFDYQVREISSGNK